MIKSTLIQDGLASKISPEVVEAIMQSLDAFRSQAPDTALSDQVTTDNPFDDGELTAKLFVVSDKDNNWKIHEITFTIFDSYWQQERDIARGILGKPDSCYCELDDITFDDIVAGWIRQMDKEISAAPATYSSNKDVTSVSQ